MVGDAHAQGMHAAWQTAGDEAEERIDEPGVEAIEPDSTLKGTVVVGMGAADFVDVAEGEFRESVKPDGMTLHGKDVDIDTAVVATAVVGQPFVEERVAVAQFGIAEDEVGILLMRLERKPRGQMLGQDAEHLQIVFVWHLHIHVVIPGDEALVAERTDECAAGEPVAQVVVAAEAVELQQHVEHAELVASQQRSIGIETVAQFLDGG